MQLRSLAVLLLSLVPALAQPRWTKVETPNFTLYTLDNERRARAAAQQFEEAHLFFESIWRKLDRDKPIRIISFDDSDKAYQQVTDYKRSAAFYLNGGDSDYIVMRDLSPTSFPVAVHEYMHLVVSHAGLKLPTWLNEGLAEVYSTITDRKEKGADKVLIGALPPTHLPFLNSTSLFPIATLLTVNQLNPIYRNGGTDTNRFYAQSWALTHMLMLHKDYAPHFNKLLANADKEAPGPALLEQATGKKLLDIEKDLDRYIRQALYRGLLYDTKLKGKEAEIRLGTLAPGETDFLLADLKLYREDWSTHAPALEALAAQYPDSPLAAESLALLARRRGEPEKEAEHLTAALQRNSTNPALVLRHARLQYRSEQALPLVVSSLQRTLDAHPDQIDVRIELAFALNRWKRPMQAYAVLVPVKSITPKYASRFFLARAYADFGAQKYDEAYAEASRALQHAREEHDRLNATNILRSIDNYRIALANHKATQTEAAASNPQPAESADAQPRLTRRAAPQAAALPSPDEVLTQPLEATLEVHATFEEFDCETRVFLLKTQDGATLRLHLEDPEKLEVRGTGTVTVDLTCGAQKHQPLAVTYFPQANTKLKTVGLLRRLHFLGFYQ